MCFSSTLAAFLWVSMMKMQLSLEDFSARAPLVESNAVCEFLPLHLMSAMNEASHLKLNLMYQPTRNKRNDSSFHPLVELTLSDLPMTYASYLGIQPRRFVSLGLTGG